MVRREPSGGFGVLCALLLSVLLLLLPAQVLTAVADTPVAAPYGLEVSPRAEVAIASWVGVDGAASYLVEVSTDPGFAAVESVPATDSLVVLDALTPATTYYVRVRSVGADGSHGSPGATASFTTTEPPFSLPTPVLTVDSDTSRSLTPTWSSAGEGVRYEVQLATDQTFTSPKTETTKADSTTLEELKTTTSYSTRVRAVDAEGTALSDWSNVITRKPAASLPLKVGSFNIKKSTQANWPKRRTAVANTILNADLDVVGLQEATPHRVKGGWRQYQDVVKLLGNDWALTDGVGGGPGEVRTVYNQTRLTMLDHGYRKLAGGTRFGYPRYAAWAIFEQRSTGKRFVFVNTHLAYQKSAAASRWRTSAAKEIVGLVESSNPDKLPVIIGGDFNTGAPRNSSNGVYRTLTGAGYIDPLARTGRIGAAEKLSRANLRTVNGLARKARVNPNRNVIDMLLVSAMRVSEWETVAKLDSAGRFVGTIPSDHNMIRITAYLP